MCDSTLCGSSPLTRGKRPRAPHLRAAHRLIPAHAGKTLAAPRGRRGSSAHPRSRGENVGSSSRATSCRGSSPLTRGKLRFGTLGVLVGGLIPAHAGKTRLGRRCVSASEAHPRSRGENAGMHAELWGASGSSPLTRGKLRVGSRLVMHERLIPAHAGKTNDCPHLVQESRAHPRSRGENELVIDQEKSFDGSSPLTRGKQRS